MKAPGLGRSEISCVNSDQNHHRIVRSQWIVLDAALRQTNDFYELVVERHRRHSTIWVSNREPAEWLGMTSDALLAQSAIDRLTSGAHHLVVEGPSYRQRGRVDIDATKEASDAQ